jgi:cytochrome P450
VLADPTFWDRGARERDIEFSRLRHEAPVSRHGDFWAVVRHADIRAVSRDPGTFCSGRGVLFGDVPREIAEATQSIVAMDAPRHTKLRGLVNAAFTPRQIRRIEEGIARDARVVVERAAPTGGGEFVELIAKHLPLLTISDMVGVPESDRDLVCDAANRLVTGDLAVQAQCIVRLTEVALELAAFRAEHPADDVMTELVHARIDGERLTHQEIAAFFCLLSAAGNDTTRHTSSHALHALTLFPDERSRALKDMPRAVEEMVRWASPALTFRRTATRDVELGGQPVTEGDKVVLFFHSGNRDESVFEAPWQFDAGRTPNHHVGFGGGGPHYCLGAALARTQLRCLFTALLTRLPDIEADEPEVFPGAFIHGVSRMNCRFTPG